MKKEELKNIIDDLISLHQEGSYWDFKKEWHSNNDDLLHDIICFANNLVNKDAYLIIGVSNDYQIHSVKDKPNRKTTQNIVDFLKDKNFAGGIRPTVIVETLTYDGKEIDILITKNTNTTPYYLIRNFQSVNPNNIYTRLQDTNTPKNRSADINHVEYLWKKRFGIEKPIMERLHIVLDDWFNWGVYSNHTKDEDFIQGGDIGNKYYIFHRNFPEFKIEILREERHEWSLETMMCFYHNQTSGHNETKIFFNNTELFSFNIAYVDEGRKHLVVPETGYFTNEDRKNEIGERYELNENKVFFYYMLQNSIKGKVQKIITNGTYNTDSRGVGRWWLLVFEDENDYENFQEFAQNNQELYKIRLKNGENAIGDEKRGAHIPMADTHNAYRYYVEYLIQIKNRPQSDFEKYFKYYEYLSSTKN